MPTIDPTTAATLASAATGAAGATQKPRNELDKDAFLKLLVAQMRYQDPTSPMDSSSFMAQTSQLTSVEKLSDLATTSRSSFEMQQRLGSAALIGRSVSWTADDGTTSSGTVASVALTGSTPMLRVGSQDIAFDKVTVVASTPAAGA